MAQGDRGNLLIANAEVGGVAGLDVRCRGGRVSGIGPALAPADEPVVDAGGGALIPGLNDHHIHLFALAATARSIRCGPPEVANRKALEKTLRCAPGSGWIRGVGYHESVAGMLDARLLDDLCGDRPVRIQHRSGKMWFLNSLAMRELGTQADNGQLFRQDQLLRERLAEDVDLTAAVRRTSRELASYGVTGITDATPSNNLETLALHGRLPLCQRINLMGDESLPSGHLKIMLDDAALPPFDRLAERIGHAHARARPVAFHCVTRTELVFALAALEEAGALPGDRIEHAAVTDAAALRLMQSAELTVVTQPNFIAERGAQYEADVPVAEHDLLYRCRAFLDAGIPLGGGTDAPFGLPNPWRAMAAAVQRRTPTGSVLGAAETLTPEQALALFTTPLDAPGGTPRQVERGVAADLCILDRPWRDARRDLADVRVAATILGGWQTYDATARGRPGLEPKP